MQHKMKQGSKRDNTKKNVILIHGMWMNAFSLKYIGSQLKKKGWQVTYFNYSSMFTSLDQNISDLYAVWKKTAVDNTHSDCHLVGHSLGGLLVLAMIEKYQLQNLPRTVLMGCPANGSAVVKKMLPSKVGRAALGKSAQALLQGVSCYQQNKIGVIMGDKGIGIGHMIQKLPKPHDGVVSFGEADLKCAEDKIILPVTHASMLFSRKTADAIDRYLSAGHF